MKMRQRKRVNNFKRGGPHRCKDYCPECPNCEMFKFFNRQGRFPAWEEIR